MHTMSIKRVVPIIVGLLAALALAFAALTGGGGASHHGAGGVESLHQAGGVESLVLAGGVESLGVTGTSNGDNVFLHT